MELSGNLVKNLQIGAVLSLVLLMPACGSGTANSPTPPTPTPVPTPTPTPTPTVAPNVARLKAALSLGAPRTVAAQDVVFTIANSSSYPTGVAVSLRDPKIRLLGGLHLNGPFYPRTEAWVPQATNYADPLPSYLTYSDIRHGNVNGAEFVLPPGQKEFELRILDAGDVLPIELAIDGVLTSDGGYLVDWKSDGNIRFFKFVLPASSQARRITLYTNSNPLSYLILPAGETLAALPTAAGADASIVFEGDSITEGAVAGLATRKWTMQAALRLGIRNPIIVGVGGSGYLARLPGTSNIPMRIENVVKAVDGGPPDAVVVAAGINDCSVAEPSPFPVVNTQTAALNYFQALRSAAPSMLIFVVGPFTDYNNPTYSTTSSTCRDAIFQAARQVSLTYTIDASDWVTPANRDIVFNGRTYGPHPVDAGHQIYGQRAASAISAILTGL